jgi:hypothetical protein
VAAVERIAVSVAKTRSWEQAEKFAQAYLDSFDSEKQELKRLRADIAGRRRNVVSGKFGNMKV